MEGKNVKLIERNNITDAFTAIVSEILKSGEDVNETKEILNLAVVIKYPKREVPITYHFREKMMDEYVKQFLNKDNLSGFEYTYGNRIFEPNQVENVINKLRHDKNTRQAIIHMWRVEQDMEAPNVPCMQTIQFFIRNGALHTTAYIRSNDMGLAWVSNVNGIVALMQLVAFELKCKIGTLTTISASAHINMCEIGFIRDNFKYNKVKL